MWSFIFLWIEDKVKVDFTILTAQQVKERKIKARVTNLNVFYKNLKKAKGDQVSLDAQMQALKILNSYREYGYLAADLNPIKKNNDFLKQRIHYILYKST